MKKKIIAVFSVFIAIILVLVIIVYNNSYKNDVYVENKTNNKNQVPGLISLMLETKAGSGIYNLSPDGIVPAKGYKLNTEKSGCENGGTLSYNETTKKVIVKTNISDKCYAYFDVIPTDVTLAITNRPTTYGKLGSINCTGSSATYNQQYNRVEISSFNGKYSSCSLNYTDSTSKVNLASYIMGLSGKTQGTGKVVNENGYRYEGKNPNNYIWFNNEYWRIIGVFDSASHGQSNKNLVKIIRDDVLDGLVWDKSNTNDWTASSLKSLLNGAYYKAQDGTSSGYCYGYSTTVTANCDYTKKGIQSGYRGMIANVTWHLGGYSSTSATSSAFYGYERGTKVYSGRPTSTTGYIGLMYPSDYGYSVLSSSCTRTTNLGSYGSATCAGQSWLYGKGYEWTLTPISSDSNKVFYLYSYGYVRNNPAYEGYGSRPVLYLDASVYKIDGDGSLNNPYIVRM
ncbi:MAG: hypothetical protein U0M92_02845 [Bacilli bacterium]